METIKEKIENAFNDIDSHSYNNYKDDDEYILALTIRELKWLREKLK